MASIATANIMKGQSATPATSFTTSSCTPTSGRVCFLAVASSLGSLPNVPTVSGASVTWTQRATVNINSFVRITLFSTYSTSPGTGALLIDFAGQSQDRCCWILDDFTNTRISGTNAANAIRQTATNSAASTTTVTATLSTFGASDNATYGANCIQSAGAGYTIAAGSGFAETAEQITSDNFLDIETEFRADNDTSVDFTASSSTNHLGVIGVEIANISSEGSGGHVMTTNRGYW